MALWLISSPSQIQSAHLGAFSEPGPNGLALAIEKRMAAAVR